MKLYYAPGACSLAPHITARELGIPVDLVKVDIPNKKTEDGGDFWAVNPKGYVPALETEAGEVLTEAGIICQYLADQRADAGFIAPFGTPERYRQMAAMNFVATEVHKQIGALFNPALTPEMRTVQLGVIERRLKPLEQSLAGRTYAMGEQVTVVDPYLYTILRWMRIHKLDLAKWPNIAAYMERMGNRAKVQETLKEEGLPV
ncbi:glutathione transferase GstA [Oxalobacteraceae bacterium OM1]|nr:glutathione transferase GstA [Oxalobacteraceae bacterium OM1]